MTMHLDERWAADPEALQADVEHALVEVLSPEAHGWYPVRSDRGGLGWVIHPREQQFEFIEESIHGFIKIGFQCGCWFARDMLLQL